MKILLLISLILSTTSAKPFEEVLKVYLNKKLSSFERIEFSIIQMPKDFRKVEINNEKNLKLVKNYAYVPVKIYDEKNNISLALVTARVKLFKTVLVTKQKLNGNSSLTEAMFETKLEDVASVDGNLVDAKDLHLYRSKGLIREGTILSKDFVELIPIINNGDKIVLHTGKNGVEVTLEAVTREDGHLGQVIRVQANNRIFKAKVIDKYNLMLVE